MDSQLKVVSPRAYAKVDARLTEFDHEALGRVPHLQPMFWMCSEGLWFSCLVGLKQLLLLLLFLRNFRFSYLGVIFKLQLLSFLP